MNQNYEKQFCAGKDLRSQKSFNSFRVFFHSLGYFTVITRKKKHGYKHSVIQTSKQTVIKG